MLSDEFLAGFSAALPSRSRTPARHNPAGAFDAMPAPMVTPQQQLEAEKIREADAQAALELDELHKAAAEKTGGGAMGKILELVQGKLDSATLDELIGLVENTRKRRPESWHCATCCG